MRKIFLYTLIFIMTPCLLLKGQEISVTSTFDTSAIYLGDQINFSVIIDQPADVKVTLPFLKDTLVKNIEILSGPDIDTAFIENGKIRITEKYLITSFDSGHYVIDPVYAEITDHAGIKKFFSGYSEINVLRVDITPTDTTQAIFDIVRPYRAPVTFDEIVPWLLFSILIAILVWLLIRMYRRFSNKSKEVIIPENIEPAHIIAFRELEKLKEEKLWQTGETKKYYTRLTEILRMYLENRFGVFSMELTTSETLDALLRTGFAKNDAFNKLKRVLTGADLVKFAKFKPEPSDNESNFKYAWDFVLETKKEETDAKTGEEDLKSNEEGL